MVEDDSDVKLLMTMPAMSFFTASATRDKAGYAYVRNLNGGIKAWAEQVDLKMPRY